MNKNSSTFTFGFAAVMVLIVAILLSVAAIGLKPFQDQNVKAEKMQSILQSIGVNVEMKDADSTFNHHIREQIVLSIDGKVVEGEAKAFDIDLKKEQDKIKAGDADKQLFPLFVFKKEDSTFYVIPLRGKGLWGPIWGYIALLEDKNTVYGASFDHKGETPGLGAEISTDVFEQQFLGKKIFDEGGKFASIKVMKGGAKPSDKHAVDAISGGTVTSNGVSEMLSRTLKSYVPYLKGGETSSLQ